MWARVLDAIVSPRSVNFLIGLIALWLTYVVVSSSREFGLAWQCWDAMGISGFVAASTAVWLARKLPARLDRTLAELRFQNTLIATDEELTAIKNAMAARGRVFQICCGLLVASVVLGSFISVFHDFYGRRWSLFWAAPGWAALAQHAPTIVFSALSVLLSFWAGAFLGSLANYGAMASVLSSPSIRLRLRPDHFDGAAGLGPIGRFYLFQALLTGIPLVWLAGWWLFIPEWEKFACTVAGWATTLESWRVPFLIQWLVLWVFVFLGFIGPMLKLRRRIRVEKRRLERGDLPGIEQRLRGLQEQRSSAPDAELQEADRLARQRWHITRMGSWPMDEATMRRYFSVQALGSVVPVGLDLLSALGLGGPDSSSIFRPLMMLAKVL